MFFKKRTDQQRDTIVSYKQTFGTDAGKQTLFDLMNRFHMLNSHKGDPYLEGQRSVILYIIQNCHINLAELDTMLKGE